MTATLTVARGNAHVSHSTLEAMLHGLGIDTVPQALVCEHMERELANAPPSTRLGRYLHRRGYSPRPFDRMVLRIIDFLSIASAVGAVSVWLVGGLDPILYVCLGHECHAVCVWGNYENVEEIFLS